MLDDDDGDDGDVHENKDGGRTKGKGKETQTAQRKEVQAKPDLVPPVNNKVNKGKEKARDSLDHDQRSSPAPESKPADDSLSDDEVNMLIDGSPAKDDASDSDTSNTDSDFDALEMGPSSSETKLIKALKTYLDKVEAETAEAERPQAVYRAFDKFARQASKKVDFVKSRDRNIAMMKYYFSRTGITDDVPWKSKDGVKKKPAPKPKPKPRNSPRSKKPVSKKPVSRLEQILSTQTPSPPQSVRRGRSASRLSSAATQPPESSSDSERSESLDEHSPAADKAKDAPRDTTVKPCAKWMEKPLEFFKEGPAGSAERMKSLVAAWVEFERSKGFPEVRDVPFIAERTP